LPQHAPRRRAPYWLAAEAGGIGAGVVLLEGVVGASAGRLSQPARPVNAANNNTGIVNLDIVMISSPVNEGLRSPRATHPYCAARHVPAAGQVRACGLLASTP
jgi:hypothetical protein